MKEKYVFHEDALTFASNLKRKSVRLAVLDPPYYGIVKDEWDNQWSSPKEFVSWLYKILEALRPALTSDGSLLIFGGLGKPKERPFLDLLHKIEKNDLYVTRNWITWGKRRAYGKSHDYLYLREELLWFSASEKRKKIVFNVPYTKELRGYKGFNPLYPAKSPYKRVGNVWHDIPELMRTERSCQKPIPLLSRIVETHSNKGDLVVDLFSGWGTTGVASLLAKRKFRGCDLDKEAVKAANERCRKAVKGLTP
jgi:DNA modification methylase